MKHFALPCLALGFVFFAAGCGDSMESCTKDAMKLMEKTADTLEGIKTKGDAEDAKDKLAKYKKEMEDIAARSKKIMESKLKDKTSNEEKIKAVKEATAGLEKYKDDAEKLEKRIKAALKNMDPEARAIVEKELPGISGGPKGF